MMDGFLFFLLCPYFSMAVGCIAWMGDVVVVVVKSRDSNDDDV